MDESYPTKLFPIWRRNNVGSDAKYAKNSFLIMVSLEHYVYNMYQVILLTTNFGICMVRLSSDFVLCDMCVLIIILRIFW
jgi:hypothetical protein